MAYGASCHTRDHSHQRSLTPREVLREADFPRGERHFKHVPPLTYLIYLSPKELELEVVSKVYDWSVL